MSKFEKFSGWLSSVFNRLCSPSKTFAFPLNIPFSRPPSTPASFNIALNSGDKLPPNNLKPPVFLKGFFTL